MPWPATPPARTASGPAPTQLTSEVDAARRLAGELLAPAAEATDRAAVVPRSHLDALAGAVLMGLYRPPRASPAVVREVYEVLAGACGVSFFVWVQHHAPVRMLVASDNASLRDRYLDDLGAGRVLGGVAFAYLRRPDPPAVTATPVPGGYRIDGEAPWVTSWGLAGLYAVAARLGSEVVFFLVETGSGVPAIRASAPLDLAAMGASATVRLTFDGLYVPEDDILSVVPFAEWQEDDRIATAKPSPPAFGIAATCIRLLGDTPLAAELDDCRSCSYALADAARTDDAHVAAMVDARARSLVLAVRAASALVADTGGRAMGLDHPAQRLLREAAFFTIQAQTPAVRRATLAQLRSI